MIFKFGMIESYHCPYCPYMTTRMFNFKRHCRAAHKIVVSKDHDSEIGQEQHTNILIKHPQDQTRQEEHQCGTRFKDASTQRDEIIQEKHPPLMKTIACHQLVSDEYEYDQMPYDATKSRDKNCKKRKPIVINSKGVFILE